MALDVKNIVALMKQIANCDPAAPVAYSFDGQNLSYADLNETLRNELSELAGDYKSFRRNKETVFSIMEEYLDDILPKKLTQRYEDLAEVRVFPQGTKIVFKRRLSGRNRAKQFITRVGLAGRYEVFKLNAGEESFEVPTSALGGAAQVALEEMLDSRADLNELTNIILEGIDECIYHEVTKAMAGAINQLPPANRVATDGFDETAFDTLIQVASAYGTPTIYCTYEFAVKMVPADSWRYSENMKNELWRNGRLLDYKGIRVVILEQTFEDETNSKKVVDPGYAWIIPTGADTKPVKVAIEGNTLVRETENEDWSREFQAYLKVGVVAMLANNICSYVDTSLKGKLDTWPQD